jgi:antitoxin VapB
VNSNQKTFGGVDEIYIRRDTVTGDLILSASRISTAWSDFFALRDQTRVPPDFMNDRPLKKALKARKVLEDR